MSPAPKKKLTTLFTANGCPHCHQARQLLQQAKVPFVELNISHSTKAAKQLQRLGAKGVPVLKHGQTLLFGFQPRQWRQALGLAAKKNRK